MKTTTSGIVSPVKSKLVGSIITSIQSMTNRKKARVGKLAVVAVGKGRFGKRPPSFTIERGGHSSNDNSDDSGFGWDSNSESQFSWGSSEDIRCHPISAATLSSPAPVKRAVPEKFIGLLGKPELNLAGIDTKPMLPITSAGLNMMTAWDCGKVSTLAPTSMIIDEAGAQDEIRLQNSSSQLCSVAPVTNQPVKRAKFNFQTPSIPAKSASGLRLRNQNQNQTENTPNRQSAGKRVISGAAPTLTSTLSATSRDGRVQLQILAQPEEQHRARYQTEGSRGAIKDRKGNGFPAVKLVGYDKPTTLQLFIGTDQGKVSPHMFYQACKVSGKSSTPCNEKKIEGTMVIEIEFEPGKEMMISCDCVGILKERNVDVEQRFPFNHASSSRKKSTKCRLIFRTTIINSEGVEETLLAASLPILCTQPPGQPEICKKSLCESSASGGAELFIIGKNFLKDTKVIFQEESNQRDLLWETRGEVLKDFLQQSHLICVIPPYRDEHIQNAVNCNVYVSSGGKMSEPHRFTYLPKLGSAVLGASNDVGSCVVSMDQSPQSETVHNSTMQQQLTHCPTTLPYNLSVANSFIQESLVENTMAQSESNDMVQVQPALAGEGRRNSLNATQNVTNITLDNALMATPTTMQQESIVVQELQSLLDQSSKQGLGEIGQAKEPVELATSTHMNATTFLSQQLSDGLAMGNASFQNHPVQNTLQPMTIPIQITNYANMSQQMSPNLQQYQTTDAVPMSCILGPQNISDMLNMAPGTNGTTGEHQHLSPTVTQNGLLGGVGVQVTHSLPDSIMSSLTVSPGTECLAPQQNIINVKLEPLSPLRIANQQEVHPITTSDSIMTNYGTMGGNIQQQQGGIANVNVITQMSDNELLSYINPSCFDQVMKN